MRNVTGPDGARTWEEEFEHLVGAYQTQLLRMCYMHLRDRSMSEDAVQETFVKLYRSRGAFRGECSEKTWIMRIAINTCRDMNRAGWLRWMDKRVTPEDLPEAAAPVQEGDEDLVSAIMHLPFKLREVVLLYYYQGMNVSEIAETLHIAQSSVSGRLRRAREKLRRMLEGREENA